MSKENKTVEDLVASLTSAKEAILAQVEGKAAAEEVNALGARLDAEIAAIKDVLKERALSVPGVEKKKFSFARAIIGMKNLGTYGSREAAFKASGAQYELEVMEEAARVASARNKDNQSTYNDELGGFLVPDELSSDIIDLAMASIVTLQAGASVYSNVVGTFKIPKITSRPTGYWLAENESFSLTDVKLGNVTYSPKTFGAYVRINDALLHQTSNLADQIVRQQLADSIALGVDKGFLTGTGADKQPKGLFSTTGIGAPTGVSSGDVATMDVLKAFVEQLDVNNRLDKPGGKYSFITNPRVKYAIMRERIPQFSGDLKGEYVSLALSQAMIKDQLGYDIFTTTQLPVNGGNYPTLFGDMTKFGCAFWAGFELRTSTEASSGSASAFLQRETWVAAFQSVDSNVLAEDAFTKQDLSV